MPSSVHSLVESFDVERILPECYAAYRPLLVDGLCFFLERLPAHRFAQIVSEQVGMAADTSFADRVLALLHHCPTLHKMGQVVSRDRRLSQVLRQRLQRLESVTPMTRLEDLPSEVLQELQGLGDCRGEICLDSARGEGTTVTVSLPRQMVAQNNAEQ